MKPIIGIITRPSKSVKGNNISILYDDIINAVIKSGGVPIGITNKNIDDYLDICHGFILGGGDNIDETNLKIIRYLHKFDIPVLGICLGMQEMNIALGGKLRDIFNHNTNTLHEINLKKHTKLNSILKSTKITVNSRHTSAISKTKLKVSAKSADGVVEAIEDKRKKFFIGLEWHPENLYEFDIASRKIFDYFINMCNY